AAVWSIPRNTAATKAAAQRSVHRYAHRADPYRHDLAPIPYEEFPEGYPGYYSGLGGPYYPASFYRGFFYEGDYWTRAYWGTARGEYQRWYGGLWGAQKLHTPAPPAWRGAAPPVLPTPARGISPSAC